MKTFLMHKAHDFDLERTSPPNEGVLYQALELETLLSAMAIKDQLVFDVSKKAILTGLYDGLETIVYRQHALRDCLENPSTIRQLYLLTGEAIERQRKEWCSFREYLSGRLDNSVAVTLIYVDVLRRIRKLVDWSSVTFKSEAFTTLFTTLARELSDDYFAVVSDHLSRLEFRRGVLVSARFGKGAQRRRIYLAQAPRALGELADAPLRQTPSAGYTLHLAPRDEAGARAISELRDRGLGLAANALAKSADHILSFFRMLQTELAFYIGCLNLHERLLGLGAPVSFPSATATGVARFSSTDLYDVCLALAMNKRPVGNEIAADDKSLIIVTGANRGGKTTFLRNVGLAQLMMRSGMFAPAAHLQANIVDGLFTHYKREEDATMKSGKFDEELSRMNDIANVLTSHALVMFDKSFAATNEREGSEIARQIVSALMEKKLKVIFVSHQYDFAHGFFVKHSLDPILAGGQTRRRP